MKSLNIEFPFKEQSGTSLLFDCLRQLSVLTGLEVCFYDLTFFSREIKELNIPRTIRVHNSALCRYIKSFPAAHARCRREEYQSLKQCFVQRKPFLVHRCFAGLNQLIVPFVFRGKLIGGLAAGQVFFDHDHSRVLRKLAEKYKCNHARLMTLAKSTTVINKSQLTANLAVWKFIGEFLAKAMEKRQLMQKLEKAEKTFAGGDFSAEVPVLFTDLLEISSPRIKKAVAIIRAKYREKPNRRSLASSVGMSESTFARFLKKETGLSCRELIIKTKLSAAVYLLKRSSLNVAEISEYLGYEDVSSFSKMFKAAFGCGPLAYTRRTV